MVPGGAVRNDGPLGTLFAARRRVEGEGDARDSGVGAGVLQDLQRRILETREDLQPDLLQRRRVGPAGARRRDEVHRLHVQAPRRIRDVPLEGVEIQHRRRDSVRTGRRRRARRGVPQARAQARTVLVAGSRLARAGRRRLHPSR